MQPFECMQVSVLRILFFGKSLFLLLVRSYDINGISETLGLSYLVTLTVLSCLIGHRCSCRYPEFRFFWGGSIPQVGLEFRTSLVK
jgi:hypothetical protein